MNGLEQEQIDVLRGQLLRERDEIAQRLYNHAAFGMDEPPGAELGELSAIDNHPGDLGSEMFERGKDLALAELWEHQLDKTEKALARIEQGTYGRCLRCGQPIPYERLLALPSAEYCVNHVQDDDISAARPREEEILSSRGRSDAEETEDAAFDGGDAWQIVESWGSSTSPAMQDGRDDYDYYDLEIEAGEMDGFVEPIENFLATDIYGGNAGFVRSAAYRKYLARGEGEGYVWKSD